MSVKECGKRYAVLVVSQLVAALGVAMVIRANLGMSPAASVTYILSIHFPRASLGTFAVLFNTILLGGQILLLRKEFDRIQLLQLPLSLLLGGFTDSAVWLVNLLYPDSYAARLALLLFGCVLMSTAVSLSVTENVLMNPGEAFVKALSGVTGQKFGTVKVIYDVFLLISAAVMSWLLLGRIIAVREGTVITAYLVGSLAKLILPRMSVLSRWLCR